AHALVPVAGADVEVVLAGGLEVEAGLRRDVDHVGADARLQRGDAVGPVLRTGGQPQRVVEGLEAGLAAVDLEAGGAGLAGVAEGTQRTERHDLGGDDVEPAAGADLCLAEVPGGGHVGPLHFAAAVRLGKLAGKVDPAAGHVGGPLVSVVVLDGGAVRELAAAAGHPGAADGRVGGARLRG